MARFLLLLGLAALWMTSPSAAAERRVALVVGAAKYEHAATLAHSLDDARDVAAALKRLGFDVDLLLDPDRGRLERAVRSLRQKSRGADAALFFYSGHALETKGVNWVLPVSADVQDDRDLPFEALDLSTVLGQLEGLARVSLIFLDACRDDPFKQRFSAARGLGSSGLAIVNAAVSGTYVAFATAPGSVAADGDGAHSPFTSSLLKYIETPGIELRQMMSKVHGDVEEATDNRQIPWDTSSVKGDFYFNPAMPIVPSTAANPKLLEALSTVLPSATAKHREDLAAGYQARGQHKALAVNLSAGQDLAAWGRASAQEAEDNALELCEINSASPCVLVALDDTIKSTSDVQPLAMPRVHYTGTFDPERIPGLPRSERQRPDIAGYLSAAGYKAAAIHLDPDRFFVATGAADQHAAEEQALANCNQDPNRNGQPRPCFLYASNDQVVLPRRSTTPIMPAAAIAQQEASKPPLSATAAPALAPGPPPEPFVPAFSAQILKTEPAAFQMPTGAKVLVDDGTCPVGQLKQVIAGNRSTTGQARLRSCVPHP